MPITFKVSEKTPEIVNFKKTKYKHKLANKFQQLSDTKILCTSYCKKTPKTESKFLDNSFVWSFVEAYSNHHHISIRPDDVWISILSQFCIYININPEEHRDKFVNFDSSAKRELKVDVPFDGFKHQFDKVPCLLAEQIQKNIKIESFYDNIIPDFSTTTKNDQIVASIMLMGTTSCFFDYRCSLQCGLCDVTLEGTPSDWVILRQKLECFRMFSQISEWLNLVDRVLEKFVESANGSPDIKWWNQAVDINANSGFPYLTGWLTVFSAFHPHLGYFGVNNSPYYDTDFYVINLGKIPVGFVDVPIIVHLNPPDGPEIKCHLSAGHICAKYDNCLIQPQIDWWFYKLDSSQNDPKDQKFF